MARSRDIEYKVGFTGDTSQLEAAIKKATDSLTKLGTSPDALRKGIDGAARSALELSQHLNTAFNQDTGKLDLIKFQQSLKASGKSIQDYAASLGSLGPQGEQAFLEVASAISKAELPLRRTNNLIKQFGVTLWNTARWRITTGAINAIVGGMQQAMGYAKSLDSSLNNIRIVTGKSAEEMAQFAKEANTAAKALSTTTTTYTDASLIYYQQGLDTEAVKQRTEATIKMANVTGQSAETISSQMTAIWENFDDGSRSLESFGDSMVALGATTAASSKEIAEGLQKFAPIAQTVGLSFDYASAALTTIVANTRESASVAGTALKTLFSRLEGLKLGETLEDGTDLNKYSNALMAVGINIKDVSGNLKDMDTILDELGAKWQTLAKDQQMALAETVGGVRQYAQLVALMDNWGDFQKNLITSQTSEGALQRQADIYAESWEAARKRVKAATEDIYDSFINADQFIKLDDIFTPLLTGVASAVDALGGLTGMLPLVVMLMNNAFGDKIAQSLRNMVVNIGLMTGAEQKRARALQQTIAEEAHLLGINREDNSIASTKVEILKEEVGLQAEINSKIDQMPTAQREALNNELQMVDILKQEALTAAEIVEAREQAVENARIEIWSGASNSQNKTDTSQLFGNHQIAGNTFIDPNAINLTNDFDEAVKKLTEQLEKSVSASVSAQSHIKNLSKDFKNDQKAADEATEAARKFLDTVGRPVKADAGIQEIIERLREVKQEATNARGALRTALTNLDIDPSQINTFVAAVARLTEAGMDSTVALEAMEKVAARAKGIIQTSSAVYIDWADALVKVGTYASQAAMAIRGIGNLKDVFSEDSTLSSSEKLSQGLMSVAMIAPLVGQNIKPVVNEFKALSTTKNTVTNLRDEIKILSQATDEASRKWVQAENNVVHATRAFEKAEKASRKLSDDQKINEAVTTRYNNALVAQKAAIEARIPAEQSFTAATKAQKAAEEELTAAETALAAARKAAWTSVGITAAVLAVVATIAILIKHYKDAQEEIKEFNKAKMEAADKAKEEITANEDLIDSYESLLATYRETGEGKDALDAKAKELAQAYNTEGAALAALTGHYEDFLEKIKQLNKGQLETQQKALLNGAAGSIGFDNLYVGLPEKDLIERLKQDSVLSQYVVKDGLLGTRLSFQKINSVDEIEPIINALEQYRDDNYLGTIVDDMIQQLQSSLNKALDYVSDAAVIEVQLKAPDDFDISSFEGFKDWKTKALKILEDNPNFDTNLLDTSTIIKQAASNLGLDEWVQIQNVTEDIEASLKQYPDYLALAQSKFGKITSLEDAKVFEYLPWSQVNKDNFDEIYEQTKEYIEIQKMGAQAALNYADAEKLLQKIQSGSKLNVKDLEDYKNLFEGGTNEFIEFLTKLSPDEREAKLNSIMQDSFKEQQKSSAMRLAQIGNEETGLLGASYTARDNAKNDLLDHGFDDEDLDNVIKTVTDIQDKWNLATNAVKNYYTELEQAKTEGKEEEFLNDPKNINPLDAYGLSAENLDSALSQIDELFGQKLADNPYTEEVNQYQQALEEINALEEERNNIQETSKLEAANYEYETILLIEQVKTLGELNRLQRTCKLNTDQYAKGILNIAKTMPSAAKALKEYNDLVESGSASEEELADALRKVADIVDEDAWGQAIGKIKDANKELEASGMKLGEAEKAIDPEKYRQKVSEIAEALRGVTGASENQINESWVENHADYVQQILSGEVDSVNSAVGSIRLALFASGQDFATYAQEIGIDVNNIQSVVSALDGIEFDINGYADMSAVIQNLIAAGATATQVANLLKYIGNADIGFTVTGVPDIAEFEDPATGTVDMHAYANALKSLNNAKLRAHTNIKDIPSYTGGGGGGGGGGKKDTKDLKKDLEDIEDRYHEINRQLDRQKRIISELDKQINRTYGTGRLKLYDQKLQEINKTIDLLYQKNQEAMDNLKKDQDVLLGNTIDNQLNVKLFEGFDVFLGAGGEILNYNKAQDEHKAMLQQIVDNYNAFVEKYQAAAKAGDVSEELEKQKEEEDKLYQARLDALKQYEDSLDQVNTIYHDITEERRNAEDIKLNEITYKMELILDVREAKKQINDFSKTIEESFGDAITHGTKAIIFDEKNAQIEMDMYEHYVEEYNALHQRLAEANEYTDTTAIIDELKELEGNIIESGEALLEWLETVENMYTEALDAAAERFDWFTNQIAHDTDVLGMIKELYALQGITYKTQAGFDQLQKTSMGQYQGYLRQAQLNKAWYEDASARLQEAEKALVGVEETEVNYDALKKNRDALLEEADKAQKAMLENAKSAMETARQMYLDEIDRLSYELEQRMTNNIGFDLLEEKYNHFLEETNRFRDPIEEGLETAAWYTKLQNDIDRTSNNLYKDRLKALQEEIDLRRENNTLSQYDLDLLEAKYQVLQAQMALEDTRNNKNQLRLVRDSNGNWNYQYTANPDDLATREEELLKAKQNEYEITKNRYKDLNDEMLKMAREFAEEDKKIRQDMINGIFSEEEGAAKLAELKRYYEARALYLSNELDIVKKDMSEAAVTSNVLAAGLSESVFKTSSEPIKQIVQTLKDKGGPGLIAAAGSVFETLQKTLRDNLTDDFGNTSQEVQQHIKDIIAGENNEGTLEWMTKEFAINMDDIVGIVEDNFLSAIESYIPRASKTFEDFTSKIEDTANAIGVKPDSLSAMTQELTIDINDLYEKGKNATNMIWDQLDSIYKAQKAYLEWADTIMAVVRNMEKLATESLVPDIVTTAGLSLSNTNNKLNYDPNHDYAIDMWSALVHNRFADFEEAKNLRDAKIEGEGLTESTYRISTEELGRKMEEAIANGMQKAIEIQITKGKSLGSIFIGDTGGYTGNFDGGKIGILHEKELLLNATDTQNILEAVHIMRGISDTVFNGIANSLNSAGAASMALLGSHLGGTPAVAAGGSLEQHVTIEQVNFPGVTSSREIEEAFENLVNDAAQWVQRRKS